MKYNLKFFILILVFVNAFSQDKKLEAENFYKSIIKTYFDKDCDKLYNSINDSITILGSSDGKIYSSAKIKESRKACGKFEQFTSDLISYENYIENYEILVLSKYEFTSDINSVIDKEYWERLSMFDVFQNIKNYENIFSSSDYFIIGKINKIDKAKDLSGPFLYIVRETADGWRIFGSIK